MIESYFTLFVSVLAVWWCGGLVIELIKLAKIWLRCTFRTIRDYIDG
jgi:hypothetical protein